MKIRSVREEDASALASLLNEVIVRGGTTAFQKPFTPNELADAMLTGSGVISCFVAEDEDLVLLGFQTVVRSTALPDGIGDIATFARVDGTQKGIGTLLFEQTRNETVKRGLVAINATIRADNVGGLAFYTRLGFADSSAAPAVPLDDGVLVDRISKRYQL